MQTIRAAEARANFAALLRRVSEEKQRIVIERRGKARVAVVPIEDLVPDQGGGAEADSARRADDLPDLAKFAIDNAGDVMLWVGPDARLPYVNGTGCRLLGYTAEELSNMTIFDIDPEVDEENWPQAWERIRRRSPYTFEARYRRKDGSTFPVEVSIYCFRHAGREIACSLSRDITERVEAEAALRESEQRFRDFVDASSDWFWEMDEDCRFSYFSERFTEVTGVPQEALLRKTREETGIPDVDPESWARHLADLAARRSFRDFRHPRTLADGRVVHLSINGKAVFDETGNFKGYRGTGSDITEQVLMEEGLRRVNALFNDTERLARVGHWEWDHVAGRGTYCSDGLAHLCGVTVEEYQATAATSDANMVWVHPEDREAYRAKINEMDAQGKGFDLEYRLKGPGETWTDVHEIADVVLDDAGTVVRTFGFVQDITEHKQAEEALRQAYDELEGRVAERTAELRLANQALSAEEAKLREILDNSPVGVAIVTHDVDDSRLSGDRLFVNRAMVQMFGGESAESLVSASITDSWVDKDRLKAVEDAYKDGRDLVDFEAQRRRMDGGLWWVSMNTRPLRFDDKDCTMVWHFDITERKLAEVALRRQNRSIRFLQRIASAANESLEVEEALQICLDEVCEFTGWPVGHIYLLAEDGSGDLLPTSIWHLDAGERFSNFVRVTEATRFAAGVGLPGRVLQTVRPAWIADVTKDENFPRARLAHDIGVRAGMAFPIVIASEAAAVLEFFAIEPSEPDEDVLEIMANVGVQLGRVIERARAEAALRERETMLNAVVENVPMSLCLKDREGRFTLVNPGFERLHGVTAAEVLGKTFFDILPHEVAADAAAEDRQVLESSEPLRTEYTWPTHLGNLHELIFKFPLRPHDKGTATGIGVIALDITEQRQAEEQLRQAQKMEAVGQLTGGVAHDFNNLLGIISGNAELLAARVGENDPKIEAVIQATMRGAELTQRLLAFSRKQTLLPQAVEVNALIGGMIDLLGRSLGETIEIKTSFTPGLWRAKVDPGQLENALLNLAINARDAMPKGGTLVVEVGNANLDHAYARNHPDVSSGDYVVLAVSDNGVGMAPGVLERALEPFFTTKEVGEGSGLGLAMVYGFVKQSGGHVALYSELGHGTTVKLYLPRSAEATTRAGRAAAAETPRAKGEIILVVEDNADLRELAVAMLEDLGYRVLEAPHGRAALSLLERSDPPDLLLSDVVLPHGFSGPELAEQVKRQCPAIKVLFMSGYAEYAAVQNGLVGNAAELLNKPFRRQELAEKVRAALER